MSIKKLFDSTDTTRNYLADTNEKEAFTDVESARNASAVAFFIERKIIEVRMSDMLIKIKAII